MQHSRANPIPSAARPEAGPPGTLMWRIARRFGPLTRPLAGRRWLPLWAILRHTGRVSGRAYATPVVARRLAGGFVIPLPFGERTQWARNLLAAGRGTIRWSGRDYPVEHPEVVGAPDAQEALGGLQRRLASRAGITAFVRVSDAAARSDEEG